MSRMLDNATCCLLLCHQQTIIFSLANCALFREQGASSSFIIYIDAPFISKGEKVWTSCADVLLSETMNVNIF